VLLPLILLVLAAADLAVVAFGANPFWAQFPHGLELILMSRRLQWPLVALSLLLCISLIALVVSGRRRAWWLIGLAPLLALLAHRFLFGAQNAFLVNGQPTFVAADQATFVSDNDWVVGLTDGDDASAYPFAALYSQPLVVQSDQAQPTMLIWSAFANCARAVRIDRSIRAGELEIVSMPANALLIYNARLGQFINGVTGLSPDGRVPEGFGEEIPTVKTTWNRWLRLHPKTRVLVPSDDEGDSPHQPVLPYFPMPGDSADLSADTTVVLIGAGRPVAALDRDVADHPANFSEPLVVLVRSPATGAVVAFDRHAQEDLVPTFAAKRFPKFPHAIMIDSDSGSAWTIAGEALDGPLKGVKLQSIQVQDGVYFNVARFWYRDLRILTPVASH
jgi:hypothetical protein